jgi:RNA polymerase sigma-70 factor (ECF subfamily)
MLSTDEDDVSAVLAGDAQRFEGIVMRWQRPLVNLAYRFIRDQSLAEEMAQDAFLKCFRSLSQWRRDSQFSTWLFSIAISVYRSRLRRFEPVRESIQEMPAVQPGADEEIAGRQRNELVRRAVAGLPAIFRDPLIVFYFQEQDLASSAAILGLREGTLKARLHRARVALRSRLSKDLL